MPCMLTCMSKGACARQKSHAARFSGRAPVSLFATRETKLDVVAGEFADTVFQVCDGSRTDRRPAAATAALAAAPSGLMWGMIHQVAVRCGGPSRAGLDRKRTRRSRKRGPTGSSAWQPPTRLTLRGPSPIRYAKIGRPSRERPIFRGGGWSGGDATGRPKGYSVTGVRSQVHYTKESRSVDLHFVAAEHALVRAG